MKRQKLYRWVMDTMAYCGCYFAWEELCASYGWNVTVQAIGCIAIMALYIICAGYKDA